MCSTTVMVVCVFTGFCIGVVVMGLLELYLRGD